MDDTVAMQDTNGPACNGLASKADCSITESSKVVQQQLQQQHLLLPQQMPQQLAEETLASNHGDASLSKPKSPSLLSQQVNCDASSVASDGSQDQAGSTSSSTRQHAPPRRTYSSVDVDAAKQAAMSALAGLDMTTTKANLDASKAAAATARANGEVPAHARKSNLRSVSCRQLGSSSTERGSVGKTVAFDEASKLKPADGSSRTVQWRAGTALAADGSQPRRTTRAPASRCISLPHVLQGRAGMANRLAASYAQDAVLQQQLQLLNGSSQPGHAFAAGVNQLPAGGVPVDVLSMYQLQQQAAGAAPGPLLSQRSLGSTAATATMDDSLLQLRSGNMMLAAQQQQQQQQVAARMAGHWPGSAAGGQPRVTWAPGTAQAPQQALANQQLMVQMHGAQQNLATPAASSGPEGLWLQSPVASAALLSGARPHNLLLAASQVGGVQGMAGIAASNGLLSPQLQQQQQQLPGALPGSSQPTSALMATFTTLLEQYQTISWTVLAAAQADPTTREQVLTEVVLTLTLLHTLGAVLKSSLTSADALNDLSYLGSAARRHIATFSRLTQAGDLAVQLLAMITPLACRLLTSTDVMESTFLVLDTLALANRDVAAVVTQQRLTGLSNLLVQLPMEQLLQQQTLGLTWINSLAGAVNRNKQVLEGLVCGEAASGGQPSVSAAQQAALLQGAPGNPAGAAGGMSLGVMPLSSQPLMVSPNSAALSPSNKTPLATYFEETQNAALVSPQGTAGVPLTGLGAGVTDTLLQEGLGGLSLTPAGADDGSGLGLRVGGGLGAAAGAVGGSGITAGGGGGVGGQRTYSPLGGNLPLFGDASLLVPSSTGVAGGSGAGVATGLVGV